MIIKKFMDNVKGKEVIFEKTHCGSEGFWLEKQFGIEHNCINEPDIFGYELKKDSKKITFGDFSASEYMFTKKKTFLNKINEFSENVVISRDEFLHYFGLANPLKNNRYSWSGKCVPKYNEWNTCGQMMKFNDDLDLCVYYSFEKDLREMKMNIPKYLQKDIIIAIWKKSKLEQHINKKFNKSGFFICKKVDGKYEKLCFGKPFDFYYFVNNVKNKNIIFDSGMHEGNNRNYSQFRSLKINFWDNLITEEY